MDSRELSWGIVLELDWTLSWKVCLGIGLGAELKLDWELVKVFLELDWKHNWELYSKLGAGNFVLELD